ncbi:WD repeat domain 62 isoform X2 [Dermatophagoides farinae]|uniref:WD repeat domain 62 isoform X2 n=1 Tax=Dermatophagoides farinae TaxID=6954 RepID=UPI003F5F4328
MDSTINSTSGPTTGNGSNLCSLQSLGVCSQTQFNSFIKYSEVRLDRVLGLTVSNNASLDCDLYSGTVVYTSGCVLVLYNQRKNKQFHIINSLKKPITCCKFSKDGKYIVTGECGHQPQCRIWEVSTGEQVACLSGHKYGINCVAFSPDGKYVVSIGSQHDMMVNVWDWKTNHVVASNKVSVKVKSISFSDNGNYFVTVGNRHVKFWYLEYNDIANKNKFESLPLMGRNAILGDQRNNYFCDVACSRGDSNSNLESTYAITKSGLLCEFNNRRLLNKWVELKTESANCLTISHNYICVGCAQGVIRCFRPRTLEFVCSLPRPHQLGIDIAKGFTSRNEINSIAKMSMMKPKYSDTIAVVYDDYNKVVTAVYSDRSIYFWSLNDIKRIGKLNSFLYHSSCIWDIDVYPYNSKSSRHLLPPGTFLTCSSDDTIRIWNTEMDMNSSKASNYIYKKNFFSPELMKILYMDPDLNYLCDQDLVQAKSNSNGNGSMQSSDQYDSKNGIRAIKFSTDGKHLASGDRCGNIRIFDLEMQKDLFKIEAHDGEVLCLEYSNEEACGRSLLVSASRDRFIHIYDVHRQYSCIQNIDDHSSSITSVKFVCSKPNPMNLKLISCGADKSLIFRKQTDPESDFRLEHHVAGKCTFFDMAVDQKKNHIITASQDRLIRTYDVWTGKNVNNFKGSLGEDGALIKIAFDPSITFIATSCTDKSIYIYDYQTGECLATTSGHSEIVTGLKFSLDGRNLISVSGDGCIFIWRLPVEMTNAIASKLGLPLISDSCHTTTITNRSLNIPIQNELIGNNGTADVPSVYHRFDVSTLPTWVRKQMFEENREKYSNNNSMNVDKEFSKTLPRGRWAHRFVEEGHEMNPGLVKAYANNFETMASRSTPTTPSGINSPSIKDSIRQNNRLSMIITRDHPRTKSSLSSGVEDDDDDRNTTDSDNTYSHDSSYKVNKVSNDRPRSCKVSDTYSMVSSISMANINDVPYDDDEGSTIETSKNKDDKNRYNSLYMSTENLERIDQRNRYLKNVFENIDKSNIDNNSASDDSGINQIDHSLSSNSTLVNHHHHHHSVSPPQPNVRQSLSSRSSLNNKITSPPNGKDNHHHYNETTSDDATLSDITDINQDPSSSPDGLTTTTITTNNDSTKFSLLDTINETSISSPTITNEEDDKDISKMDSNTNTIITHMDSKTSTTTTTTTTSKTNNISSSVTTTLVDTTSKDNVKSTPTQQPFMSKKREELAKTLSEAKKRLQSVGSTPSLTNSRSVANLRALTLFSTPDDENSIVRHRNRGGDLTSGDDDDENSYHSLSVDAFRKSISLSDLSRSSCTLPRKLSIYRANNNSATATSMNNYQFAPLWDQRRVGSTAGTPPNSGSLSRTPSTNTLNKVDMMRSQSTLCRQGLWNAVNQSPAPPSTPLSVAHPVNPAIAHLKPPMSTVSPTGMIINPRSGRSSAPPSQFRKSAATISCASSSRRGDSTEDDEEIDGSAINSDDDNSDEHRAIRPRPVTPPKPNILKQIRRSSNSNGGPMMSTVNVSMNPYQNHHYVQNPHQHITQSARPRRLWSADTMRSSKSEFNLASIGRDTPVRRRNNSGVSAGGQMWPQNPALVVNDRFDLYMTNPSSIPLSLDLCQHLVNEMNFLTNYASRIHERASYSENTAIVDYLKETLGQVSRDIQAIVGLSPNKPTIPNKPDIVINNNDNGGLKQTNGNHDKNNSLTTAASHSQNNHIPDPQTQEMFQQFMAFLKMTKGGSTTPSTTTINGQCQNTQQQSTSNIVNNNNVNHNNNVNSD